MKKGYHLMKVAPLQDTAWNTSPESETSEEARVESLRKSAAESFDAGRYVYVFRDGAEMRVVHEFTVTRKNVVTEVERR